MSQTLTKPILLDETGQSIAGKLDTNSAAIVNKLNDIKDAIGTSSEFIPISIRVIAPPTKVTYKVGERLDLTGMVVNLIGSNGVQVDVTSACTCNPANGTVLTTSDTAVAISYTYQHEATTFTTSQTLTIRALDSIAVTTPPIKTAYQTGETLDLTGIVVTATYTDGFTANVTPDCVFVPQNGTVLSSSDTSVTVTYTEGGTTKTTTCAIGVKELSSIVVTHLPNKTTYHVGETLDLTGIAVLALYDDTTSLDVTNNCTFSPANGATLSASDTSVTITYTEGSTTKTTSQVIVVLELSSIAITTPPTTTEYVVGDTLDLTGIEVTATYSDNSTADVTSSCTFSPADGATIVGNETGVTASYTEGGVTKTATQAISVSAIYGAEWDGTATTAWTRTDGAASFTDPVPQMSDGNGGWTTGSSPFDTIQPWAGMQLVNDAQGAFVSIPKFYYKLTKDGSKLKVQICAKPVTGFSVSPAHMDRNDNHGERDVIYVSRYFKSNSGAVASMTNIMAEADSQDIIARDSHRVGDEYWLMDFSVLFTLWLLYLVEFADWNSQDKIGLGYKVGYGLSDYRTGRTDGMTYHTGCTVTSTSALAGATQYRHIEDLWETNLAPWIGRCYNTYSNIYFDVALDDNQLSSGGYLMGSVGGYNGVVPKSFNIVESDIPFPVFFPATSAAWDTSYATAYMCDVWHFANTSAKKYLKCGGQWDNPQTRSGLFCIYADSSSSPKGWGRIMKMPNS